MITNLRVIALSYNEGDGAVVLSRGQRTVADVDSTDFKEGLSPLLPSGATVRKTCSAIRDQGTGAGQIGVSGSNVTYQGVTIGTFTGGSSGTNLVMT